MTTKPPRAKRTRYPKHAVTFQVIEAALEVSDKVGAKMHSWLDRLHALREQLRQQRADDRETGRTLKKAGGKHVYLTKNDQYKFISALAARDSGYADIHSQVLQNVADRVERGTKAWLKGKRGPLRPQRRNQQRSFTFPQYGSAVKIRNGRLHMSKLGESRLMGLRKLPGRVKSVNLVFKQGRWFAQFTCEVQLQHSARALRNASVEVQAFPDTGLDTGLLRMATLADGTAFAPAKPLKSMLPRLEEAQRKMSRQFEARKRQFEAEKKAQQEAGVYDPLSKLNRTLLSGRLKRQIRYVAILHSKVANIRRDSLRKVARQIEQQYRLVAVEEHSTEFMRRNRRMSRAVSDVAPGMFKQLLRHTLGEGRYVGTPNRREGIGGNSQSCTCGAPVPKELKERWHECSVCGLIADRDTVSANIAMLIAFGYCNLQNRGPGQGLVRRGEGKCLTGQPAAPQLAAEPSLKRQSSRNLVASRKTVGAQATAEANNLSVLDGARAPCLTG